MNAREAAANAREGFCVMMAANALRGAVSRDGQHNFGKETTEWERRDRA
jgi:hypothetical protein